MEAGRPATLRHMQGQTQWRAVQTFVQKKKFSRAALNEGPLLYLLDVMPAMQRALWLATVCIDGIVGFGARLTPSPPLHGPERHSV